MRAVDTPLEPLGYGVSEIETKEPYSFDFRNTRGGVTRSPIPRPGVPVRGSTTGRPLMAALDLVGRRWSLRVLWELRSGPIGARALLERCEGISSSVLY